MQKIELQADNREVTGKEVRFLRRKNITPVHLFGSGLKSLTLQCGTTELEKSLAQAAETRIITLKVGNEKKTRPILVREVQRESLTGKLLHVDFYQVNMEEKVEVEVPIVLTGKAPALEIKDNTLLRGLDALTIECLPANIPASLEVNVGSLTEAGQTIRVKDVTVSPDITVLSNPEGVLVTIVARPKEKVEEKVVVEEAVAEEIAPAEEAEKVKEKPKQE